MAQTSRLDDVRLGEGGTGMESTEDADGPELHSGGSSARERLWRLEGLFLWCEKREGEEGKDGEVVDEEMKERW